MSAYLSSSDAALHSRTSHRVARSFDCFRWLDTLADSDVLVYGTSDATVNLAEVWLTAEVVRRNQAARQWWFFNYPLSERWLHYDLARVFAPYSFIWRGDPLHAVRELGLSETLLASFSGLSLQELVPADDSLLSRRLEEVVAEIRQCRAAQSFCVANLMEGAGDVVQVFSSSKNKRYRDDLRRRSFGELLFDRKVKLGGSLIYFVLGYALAHRPEIVMLCLNNDRGDVWGAVAAGVRLSGGVLRLYPVGGFDLMTVPQWQQWYVTGEWRKAPLPVVRRLAAHSFTDGLQGPLFERYHYCAISYDEDRDTFAYERGTPWELDTSALARE